MPFAVLLSLPIGLSGTYIFAKVAGIDSNIYLQISLVMLIGLLAKNAILIVEFALDRRRGGMDIIQAAIEGAVARLRSYINDILRLYFWYNAFNVFNRGGCHW